ncbi:MAG TPA: hypothetical protein P5092_18360 [Ruminococcus sp.]|nr:hypothetical protein [Ruminococcus sp.]
MNADNLSDLLQELGYEPPEKLKVNSKGKPYVIELNSDTNMGFAILERLCDNDTISEAKKRTDRETQQPIRRSLCLHLLR